MDRLTVTALPLPQTTFCFCQICGYSSKEITDFEMLWECDDNDEPEMGNILMRCKSKKCCKVIDDHPRLYWTVPWGRGGPGSFNLFCGDCKLRRGGDCLSTNLKKNGGEGMEVKFASGSVYNMRVCYSNGTSGKIDPPATSCADKVPVV